MFRELQKRMKLRAQRLSESRVTLAMYLVAAAVTEIAVVEVPLVVVAAFERGRGMGQPYEWA